MRENVICRDGPVVQESVLDARGQVRNARVAERRGDVGRPWAAHRRNRQRAELRCGHIERLRKLVREPAGRHIEEGRLGKKPRLFWSAYSWAEKGWGWCVVGG